MKKFFSQLSPIQKGLFSLAILVLVAAALSLSLLQVQQETSIESQARLDCGEGYEAVRFERCEEQACPTERVCAWVDSDAQAFEDGTMYKTWKCYDKPIPCTPERVCTADWRCERIDSPDPTSPPDDGFSCPSGCHEDYPGHCSCSSGGDDDGGGGGQSSTPTPQATPSLHSCVVTGTVKNANGQAAQGYQVDFREWVVDRHETSFFAISNSTGALADPNSDSTNVSYNIPGNSSGPYGFLVRVHNPSVTDPYLALDQVTVKIDGADQSSRPVFTCQGPGGDSTDINIEIIVPTSDNPVPTPTDGPDYSHIFDKKVDLVINASADMAGNNQPKLAVYLNNGSNLDGPYDYNSCATKKPGCGTPNLYQEKLLDTINITSPNSTSYTLENISAESLFMQHEPPTTKLSFAYYNDYWRSDAEDRNIYIHKVEVLDAEDGSTLVSFTPLDNSYYQGYSRDNSLVTSFYFDKGLINIEGDQSFSPVDQSLEQDGMIKAFDKEEIETIVQNQSRENGKWTMMNEGSFNIVTQSIISELLEKYPNNPDPDIVSPDYNNSGTVDLLDFTQLISSFGEVDCSKNLVGECIIDITDYTVMVFQFGKAPIEQ